MISVNRLFISGIVVLCLITGPASAISRNAPVSPGFITGPAFFIDQLNPSIPATENEETGAEVIYKENDTAPGLSWFGAPNYWFPSYSLPTSPGSPDNPNPLNFMNTSVISLPSPAESILLDPMVPPPFLSYFDNNRNASLPEEQESNADEDIPTCLRLGGCWGTMEYREGNLPYRP
jgi:hypothetical protein